MADAKLTPEIAEIIRRSTITGTSLVLPAQLDRKTYERVNSVIVNCGGKWNRSAKAHIFDRDPLAKLGLALEAGVAMDEKQKRQAFYTPAALARDLVQRADVAGKRVLEPSAGGGALVDAAIAAGAAEVVLNEYDDDASTALADRFGMCIHEDWLAIQPDDTGLFDRVVMNPPFTRNQDVKHVEHALRFLAPGGVLVSIVAGNTRRPFFDEVLSKYWKNAYTEPCPEGAFKESGTMVNTAILYIQNEN